MTEQRRYCYVLDNGKSTFYDLNKKDILQMYQVEDLLNEQYYQIKELKKANKQLKDTYEQYIYFLKQVGDD